MKNLLLAAVLGMAALGVFAGQASAGPFKCKSCCGCGANFCVRQYNAFSPVCFGTVYCDGILPLGSACFPPGASCFPPGCNSAVCPDGSCAGGPLALGGDAFPYAPGATAPHYPFVAGQPTPLPQTGNPQNLPPPNPGQNLPPPSPGQQNQQPRPNPLPMGPGMGMYYPMSAPANWVMPVNYGYPMQQTPMPMPGYWYQQ
jgi:hypothetical protein